MIAACYRGGIIVFRSRLPKGALPIASGETKKLRQVISELAVHHYDGKTLLVPEVSASITEDEAKIAVERFCTRVRSALRRQAPKATP